MCIRDSLYVDQPVGVGFSKVQDNSSYCLNKKCISNNMFIFLKEFFNLHPEYTQRPFYVAGVSYAGHYVLTICDLLVKEKYPLINFSGIILVSPWLDALKYLALDALYLYENKKIQYVPSDASQCYSVDLQSNGVYES
eukprot:TRINITY_DN3888_c0_g2_i1.p1 TRINITY_DN3888_c0_g2~~TRINITY_DN3888_c0_g2_i1.p1  ORF type:complete len:146 (-),score=6.99 TRINITY_DN3888_c0_g2_i1:13-426(-)